jgi:transcriptional regulator
MYIKPEFQPQNIEQVHRVIKQNPFAVCVTTGADGRMFASHLPFLFDAERGAHGTLITHIARANEQTAHLYNQTGEVLVIFQGVHGYISPSWYLEKDSAPTWNYAVVHCYGKVRVLDDKETVRAVGLLVKDMEQSSETPWTMRELGAGGVKRRLPKIHGLEIEITEIQAKFKMNQGERAGDTQAAIRQLEANGETELAAAMREHNQY